MTTTSAHEDTLVLGEALAQAVTLMKAKQLDAADELLARILESAPGDPDALHYQGLLRHAQGRADESIALIGRSLTLQPVQSGAWNNLGNLLIEAGRVDDAMRAYENSVSFATGDEAADALSNIATLERGKGQWQAAERVSRRAIELRPAFSEAWYNLSIALMEQGRIHESVIANSRAVVLQPRNMSARGRVIRALELLGEREQAIGMYREWLAEAPGNPVVSHLLAACEGHARRHARATAMWRPCSTATPEASTRASRSCTTAHPNWWRARCETCIGPPAARIAVVDAGCGTGLCAPLLRPWAAHLAGCDLSVGMLQRAEQRGGYDVLHKAELTHYLPPSPPGSTWWHRPTRCAISATCTRCWRQPRARCARKAAWCSRSRPWPGVRTTSRSKAAAATAMRQRMSRPALRPPVSAPSASSRSSRAARPGRTCRVGWPAQGFVRIDAGHGSPNFKLPDINRLQQRYGVFHE
jgi:Flp pilus assembly protein TadD